MNILLTGGTGYIGSHTAAIFVAAGHRVILYDNLCNSQASVAERLKTITGHALPLVVGDVRDTALLSKTLATHQIEAVIHFAGLKAVGDSVKDPVTYFDNNVGGTISLLQAMKTVGLTTLVFSSSATVYGAPHYLPYDELHPTAAMNPYGRSKLHIEELLSDLAHADADWRIACLRYFNPVGAHDSGLIGEDPSGIPNNLMPYVARVASKALPQLTIFGSDYDTPDGTGVRDYVHVMDLAEGHLAALISLPKGDSPIRYTNLGTGIGVSVLQLVEAFQRVSGQTVPHILAARRSGDLPAYYADVAKAKAELGWTAKRTLEDMCKSTWHFQVTSRQVSK